MNEILQQLLSQGPALGAGLAGNGNAMKAFQEGFARAWIMDQQRKRLTQQDQYAAEDRERLITRQAEADANARADRARAGDVQKQQDFLNLQRAQGGLVETAGLFDDPMQAKSYIESQMPTLMSTFGQEAMSAGQPAVDLATQTITGRQKKQVESFVEQALKTEHVANHPDLDPELTNLPAHIVKLVGKDTARLSELQTYAQMPVGKPQGKTRVPAMPGSQEDYIGQKYGDNPTPEQILEGRRAYADAGREPDKPNQNAGQYPPQMQRRIDALAKGFESQPIVKKVQVMAEAVSFADGLNIDTKNPADDQALIYAFAKAMDPESVVREGEYATVQKYAQSWAQSFGFDVARVFSNTPFLTREARANMKKTIRAKFDAGRGQYENVRREYGRRIERITQKPGGVDELTDYGAAFPVAAPASKPDAPATAIGPKVGERRKINGQLAEWDGKGWLAVKM